MHVPATEGDFDELHPVLHKATRKHATLREGPVTVCGVRFVGFFAEVEGVEVLALHDLDGVFIDLEPYAHLTAARSLRDAQTSCWPHSWG